MSETEGAQNQGNQQGAESGQGQPTGQQSEGYKPPATQADLDRIISDRLNRERARFADYETLRDKAGKFDASEAEKASEVEKARREGEERGRTEANAASDRRVVAAEAKAVAAKLKFHNPADVTGLIDFSTVKVTNGEPDETRIQELIEDAVKTRPYLVASTEQQKQNDRKRDPGQGARTGSGNGGLDAGRDLYAERRKPRGTTKT